MKATREYEIHDGLFIQTSYFLPDDDSLDDAFHVAIQISVSPDSIEKSFFSMEVPEFVPLGLRVSEMEHALSVLRVLYDLTLSTL